MSVDMTVIADIPESLLSKLVLPGPYPCSKLWPGDPRFTYCGSHSPEADGNCISLCGRTELSDGLHPMGLSDISRWKDSVRVRVPLGTVPCCPTPPHCMAPVCSKPEASMLTSEPGTPPVCTKYAPETYYAYLTHPHVWPAFFGSGGSYDLDVQKHWDVLGSIFGCYDNSTGRCLHDVEPFDLAIDLGADYGSFTERFTARKFAKDFILVDAYPPNKERFHGFFGDGTFLHEWYQEQVKDWPKDKELPHFQFFTNGLSNVNDGSVLDLCDGNGASHIQAQSCPAEIVTVDSIIPGKLSSELQSRFENARSAYIKMDLEGMDQLAIDGMRGLLNQVRGENEDGTPRYLVNFMMLEFCPSLMVEQRQQKGISQYDLGTQVKLLEDLGFEVFMMGPRYLPLSHGSWLEEFNTFLFGDDSKNPLSDSFPEFASLVCPGPYCRQGDLFAADLFAMRASHPRAVEIKLALGVCSESHEFDLKDKNYQI